MRTTFQNVLIKKFLLFCALLQGATLCAGTSPAIDLSETSQVYLLQSGEFELTDLRPSPLLELFKNRQRKNKKLTAALLSFPFPFGIVGLHRIYLGSAPYVPVVYIATFGGAFGVLPLIDFCVLLLDKNIEPYIKNDKVFMWVN